MTSRLLLLAAVFAACLLTSNARRLLNDPAGTVEIVKPLKMYDDPSGGVPPLEERIKAVEKLLEPRLALIAVEAKCKEDGDDECEELKELKKKQALEKKFKDAEENGEEVTVTVIENGKEKEVIAIVGKEEPEVIKAPCITNVFLNYFLGTTCLPDKPIDVKPEEEEEGDRK